MKKYEKTRRPAAILALLVLVLAALTCVSASAEILPGLGGTDNMPSVSGRTPDMSEPITDGEYRAPVESSPLSPSDGARTGGGAMTDTPTDGGGAGAAWGTLIAIGIAVLAVIFIFLIMPRGNERKEKQSGDRR